MKIALLASLKRPITPHTTVSRNRIVFEVARGLVKKGHHVSVFGTSDSTIPGAEVIGVIPKGLHFLGRAENPFYQETAYITHATLELLKREKEFDLIHNHMYPEFLPLLASFSRPLVTTIHTQISEEIKLAFSDLQARSHLVVLSKSAQNDLGLPSTVIYNGIDSSFFTPDLSLDRSYFLFVGRMSKAKGKDGAFLDPKGVTDAIAAAQKADVSLKIVGNVEDKDFYDTLIAPELSETIEFVGKVSQEQNLSREEVRSLYQHAKALLLPIRWNEPFGLVMTEAASCGTPVIAYDRGSVPEIVEDKKTGYIVDSDKGVEGFASAIKNLNNLSEGDYAMLSKNSRKKVEENFTDYRMVEAYEKLYLSLV